MPTSDANALAHGLHVYPFFEAAAIGPGRARAFTSGDTDYLSGAHSVGAETTFSLAAWIKISSVAGLARYIFGLYSTVLENAGFLALLLTTGGVLRGIVVTTTGVGSSNDFGSTDLRDGEWHLVALTWDGSIMTVFVDGVADVLDVTDRSFPTINSVAIGCRVDATPDGPFEGDIDECSLWEGTAITEANVASMYAIGNNQSVVYLDSFAAAGIPTPTHHWSLSEAKNPGNVGADEIGSVDLTDNGTADVEGIPAAD